MDDGRLTPEAAASHPQRSLLLRALDGRTEAEPDLSIREVRAGDRYLLCSDGLSDVVTEQTLHKTLITFTDPDDAVIQLVELAIRSGGPDNITCIVADVVDAAADPAAASREPVVVGAASNSDGSVPARRRPIPTARPGARISSRRYHRRPGSPPRTPATTSCSTTTRTSDEDDDGRWARPRWPVVTSILVVLLLLIAGGGYAAGATPRASTTSARPTARSPSSAASTSRWSA